MIRDYDPAQHWDQVRSCVVELQEFERELEPSLPRGKDMADAYLTFLRDRCSKAAGPNLPEVARQSSDYVVRILLGTPPRDLPVVEPTRFELVINLKTADARRLTIPREVLLRADKIVKRWPAAKLDLSK